MGELQKRLMKAYVRIKGTLKGILENTNAQQIPPALIAFLANLVKKGQYIPDNFLSQFELDKLDLNPLGAINDINDKQMEMIIGNYILIKILVCKVLANPQSLGFIPSQYLNIDNAYTQKLKINFKVLTSLLFYTVIEYMELLLKAKGYADDLIFQSGLKDILYKQEQLKFFYSEDNYPFRCELFEIIEAFLR